MLSHASLLQFDFELLRAGACCSSRFAFTGSNYATRPAADSPTSPTRERHDSVDFASRESDARTRLILKDEKKDYDEHVARAKEATELAAELHKMFEIAHSFNAADRKKLDRLEKFTPADSQ